MFDSHRATWDSNTGKIPYIPFALCYFLALFFIGNLLLFNLFIAILLSNFGDDEEEPEKPEAKQFIEWNFNGYLPAGAEKKTKARMVRWTTRRRRRRTSRRTRMIWAATSR